MKPLNINLEKGSFVRFCKTFKKLLFCSGGFPQPKSL